jgi:hypothetical protein
MCSLTFPRRASGTHKIPSLVGRRLPETSQLTWEWMINRRQLECASCGTVIITRTGIGHGNVQKHKFACLGCGVEIGYTLNLDQETVSFEYEEPTNASWKDSKDETELSVLFYPELMIPKSGLPHGLSPFIATFGNHKDIQEYQKFEATRRHIKRTIWPLLQRTYVHFETGNFDLLEKDAAEFAEFPKTLDSENRAGWLMSVNRHFFDFFVADPKGSESPGRLGARAVMRSEEEVRRLAGEYVKSGRMKAIWKEIKSIRRQFMELYESLLPLLMVRRYWRDDRQNIEDYELSVKNFEDVKGFYIDCVETSYRLLVIGLALALIESTGKPTIQTKTGNKNIWWFEQISNGIKNGQLDKYPELREIAGALDLGLRNGVGHHSAHYDVRTDEIGYVKADDAALEHFNLPFTKFVDKVFQAFCAFERATTLFHYLFVAGKGKLE